MKIYVVIRAALQELGEFTMVTTEFATTNQKKAQEFIAKGPVVWNERLQNVNYVCERAIHEVELEQE